MARDPEPVKLKVVAEETPPPKEVVRLTAPSADAPRQQPAARTTARPAERPAERLVVEARAEERRTHEPGVDALIEQETNQVPLEETWSDESRPRQPMPWGWFVLIGLIGAGAVLWSVSNVTANREQPRAARAESLSALKKDEEETAAAAARVDRILNVAKAYLAADSVAKLLPLVRQPEQVRPLMESWYQSHPLKAERFQAQEIFQPLDFRTRASFWLVGCSTQSGGRRRLIVEELPGDKAAVDWEFDVTYQPMAWNHYVQERPSQSLAFRVQLQPDTFYSHEFSDMGKWQSFRLTAPDGEEALFGYAARDSELARQITEVYQANGGTEPISLILRLNVPAGLNSPRGVVIEKLLSPNWVYLDPPGT